MFRQIKKLWNYLPKRRQGQFWMLLMLMLFSSLIEIVSLGSVLPFLGILTSPDIVYSNELLQPVIKVFNINNSNELVLPLTIIFILAAIIAGFTRIILLYVMTIRFLKS